MSELVAGTAEQLAFLEELTANGLLIPSGVPGVYGRGPDDQPYLYEDGKTFILGRPLTGAAKNPKAKDLPWRG